MDDLHIVTVATEPKFYFNYLVESCKNNGKELIILGYGEKWQGYSWKFKLIIDYLKTLKESDIVCFIDGYDIICNRNLNELKELFINFKNKYNFKILTGADIYKFKLQKYIATYYFKKCNNMLLNSGTYIGYANDLKELLLKTFDLNIKSNDDQYLLTKYCIMNKNNVYIDKEQEFFLTIHKSFFNIDNELTFIDNKAYYHNKQPFFIHGPSCTYLNNVIIKLGYNLNNKHINKELRKYFLKKFIHYSKDILSNNIILFIIIFIFYTRAFSNT
jgi:hypothetical protein